MRPKILVTGANGNIGSALLRALRNSDADIVAGVRDTAKLRTFQAAGIAATLFDYADPSSMRTAFALVERAFLVLPLTSRMTEFGHAAIEAARDAGISYLVKSSELGADPASPCFAMQVQGMLDDALVRSGIPCTILRPNFFMQNFAVYYRESIRQHHAFFLPQGDGCVSLVDVRDIAAVAARLLMSPEAHHARQYDLTGSHAWSNQEIAAHLSTATGLPIQYHVLPDTKAIDTMRLHGRSEWEIEFVMSLHSHVRDGQMSRLSEHVQAITGSAPITFPQFAQEHAKLWRNAEQAP